MPPLPVMLNLAGRSCVIVGGGSVAERRARSLQACGGAVTVIAPEVTSGLVELGVLHWERGFEPGDLAGAFLAVIASSDEQTNDRAAAEARERGVLMNRADRPAEGDFTVPAHAHHGPVTLAVETGGISAAASAAIRRELSASLDPDWPRLLTLVAPYRAQVQAAAISPDRRRDLLRRLTDADALNILKNHGPEALASHCRGLLAEAPDAPDID